MKAYPSIPIFFAMAASASISDGQLKINNCVSIVLNESPDLYTSRHSIYREFLRIKGASPGDKSPPIVIPPRFFRNYSFSTSNGNESISIEYLKQSDPLLLIEPVSQSFFPVTTSLNKANLPALRTSDAIALSNLGKNSYFYVIPEGIDEYRPGRILDIHKTIDGNHQFTGYGILFEYLGPPTPDGVRVRTVSEMKLSELNSIVRDEDAGANQPYEAFLETLSPAEVDAVSLADQYGLKPLSYAESHRVPGGKLSIAGKVTTPMNLLKNNASIFYKVEIKDRFGNYDHLLLPGETTENIDVIDVFSRLDPDYVLTQFYTKDIEYMFAITEDGSFKVMPIGKPSNMEPQVFRLASGRHVFVTGKLRLFPDRTISFEINANGYTNLNHEVGSTGFMANSNPDLKKFIGYVIESQTGFISNHFYEAGPGPTRDPTWKKRTGDVRGRDWWKKKSQSSSAVSGWENTGKPPLEFEAWKTEFKTSGFKVDWGYYVLDVDRNMKFGAIKTRYRALAKKYYPDLNKTFNDVEDANSAFRSIHEAFQIVDEDMHRVKIKF